ncbi:Protein NLRC3 [Durusdinium trenchii]|uniref:Protein NLRC3 n=1 Tax=Durusdinium trenchii TaxID=1381693 RepID=A0ABP0M9I5_9DINO
MRCLRSVYQFARSDREQQCFDQVMRQMHVRLGNADPHSDPAEGQRVSVQNGAGPEPSQGFTPTISLTPTRSSAGRWGRENGEMGSSEKVPVFYWPEHPEGQGRLQGVPLKRLILNMNRTPYELRGWCQAEAQWSSMRCSSARLVLLDGLPSLPDEAGKAPMTPETFQTRIAQGSLKFTHRNDQEAVTRLQEKVFLMKAWEAHELVLSRLPRSEMPVLCDSLPYYARLQKLAVNSSRLSDEFFVALQNPALVIEELDLQANDALSLHGLDSFLGETLSLRDLNLSRNCFGDADAEQLALGLARCQSPLRWLDLSFNELGCRGCTALGEALLLRRRGSRVSGLDERFGRSFQELRLRGNRIANPGALALADCLKRSGAQLQVDLEWNLITSDVASAWVDLLVHPDGQPRAVGAPCAAVAQAVAVVAAERRAAERTKMEKRSKFLAKSLALLPLLPQAPFLAAELSSAGGAPPDLFVYATAPAALAAALLLEVFFVLCTGGCRSCRCATLDFLTFLLSSTVNALVFLLSFGSLGFATLHNATEILPGCRASLTCQSLSIFGHVLSAVVLLAWICTLRCLCVLWASSLGPCFHSKDPALMATL